MPIINTGYPLIGRKIFYILFLAVYCQALFFKNRFHLAINLIILKRRKKEISCTLLHCSRSKSKISSMLLHQSFQNGSWRFFFFPSDFPSGWERHSRNAEGRTDNIRATINRDVVVRLLHFDVNWIFQLFSRWR